MHPNREEAKTPGSLMDRWMNKELLDVGAYRGGSIPVRNAEDLSKQTGIKARKVRIRLGKQLDLTRDTEGTKKSFYWYTGGKRKKTWALSRRSHGYTEYGGG